MYLDWRYKLTWSKDVHERFLQFQAEHDEKDKLFAAEQFAKGEFDSNFKPIGSAPSLKRVNGCGVGLYGWLHDVRLGNSFIKLYFISVLWLPIVPIGAYVVSREGETYRFFARIGLWRFVRTYRLRVLGLYVAALVEGVTWLVLAFCVLGAIYGLMRWVRT